MTLLISLFTALFFTFAWYVKLPNTSLKLHIPALMFWGASLMWFVDAVVGYIEEGVAFFELDTQAMINDAFLGLCVLALGLFIWIISIIILDSRNIFKSALLK